MRRETTTKGFVGTAIVSALLGACSRERPPDPPPPSPACPELLASVYRDLVAALPSEAQARAPTLDCGSFKRDATAIELRRRGTGPVIVADPRLVDRIGAQLGARARDGLAFLLGHELAHALELDAASGSNPPLLVRWVSERAGRWCALRAPNDACAGGNACDCAAGPVTTCEREWSADVIAGFRARVAGYDAVGVQTRALSVMYGELRAPGDVDCRLVAEGYPSLAGRTEAATDANESLEMLTAYFDTGILLMLAGKHVEAATLLEELARTFPSSEVFNDAGAAWALAYLDAASPGQRQPRDEAETRARFAYPFELDAETRLRGPELRGDLPAPATLLANARRALARASAIDPHYRSALMNIAALDVLDPAIPIAQGLANITALDARFADDPARRATLARLRAIVGDIERGATEAPAMLERGAIAGGDCGERPWLARFDAVRMRRDLSDTVEGPEVTAPDGDINVRSRLGPGGRDIVATLPHGVFAVELRRDAEPICGLGVGARREDVLRRFGSGGISLPTSNGSYLAFREASGTGYVRVRPGLVFRFDREDRLAEWARYTQ